MPLAEAAGRVLAEPVVAAEDVPAFDRSTVDGYAVIAEDTFGAAEGAPALLEVVGTVEMGRPAGFRLTAGQAGAVPTGGSLPEGADAVVMVEHSVIPGEGLVELTRPVAPGENVVRAGEDIRRGTEVLPAGRRLAPADVGVLAAVGVTEPVCFARPRVAVIPTGDEIVPPDAPVCRPGQVRDVVSVALAALISRDGGVPRVSDVVPDRREALEAAVSGVLPESELVLVLGGSSVGARDHTAAVIDRCGPPGVLFHGLALKPGKPTLFGVCGGVGKGDRAVAVFGLPGHPVSALVVYRLLVRTALRLVAGEAVPAWRDEAGADPLEATVAATLTRAVPSDQGREDYVCVRLRPSEAAPPPAGAGAGPPGSGRGAVLLAEPVFGKSGLITMLAQADGLVRIPAGRRGLEPGTEVEVILLD